MHERNQCSCEARQINEVVYLDIQFPPLLLFALQLKCNY